jgi:uncharacterized protein
MHALLAGLREAGLMVWVTFWPLVLGFTLAGAVQAFVPRSQLSRHLGRTTGRSAVRASLLGVISSSCSYAASALAHALVRRGASMTNATIFLVASTNLVIELGVVLWQLLGWQFVVAEFLGGTIMIVLLTCAARLLDSTMPHREVDDTDVDVASWRTTAGWARAARFTTGDLTMLRRELVIGFVVAGYLAALVPTHAWSAIFVTHHGVWTTLENVTLAPLLAVVSFVCSVGNIPLAAALWVRGVSFGGVVAFIFADLITLPLLAIYRRFYGRRVAVRLGLLLWAVMATAGGLTELLCRAWGLRPSRHVVVSTGAAVPLGATLVLNSVAVVVLVLLVVVARRSRPDATTAIDPVCRMQVAIATAPATVSYQGVAYYFCAPRCADRFQADPIGYLGASPRTTDATPITLGRKPPHG